MKLITKDLLRFAVAASILTLIFRYFLSMGIDHNSIGIILIISLFYGVSMFLSGMYWGRRDRHHLPIFDVGFRFHLCTFIVHQIISYIWLAGGFASEKEDYGPFYSVMIIWGAILLIHAVIFFRTRNKTYKNLNKRDLFE